MPKIINNCTPATPFLNFSHYLFSSGFIFLLPGEHLLYIISLQGNIFSPAIRSLSCLSHTSISQSPKKEGFVVKLFPKGCISVMKRTILLADMNSFFASVHQALNPKLQNKPVIVGGDPATRHGIVLAASYEAKAFGVKTGMALWKAEHLCPGAVFIRPQHHLYIEFSTRILRVMREFSPLVEPFSIDEAFVDITGCEKLFGSPVDTAKKLKQRIKNKAGVSCSVGIGPNKLLAKMAAGMEKPDGLTVLNKEDVPAKLWPLPVRKLFGVGPRYEHHLHLLNIRTIGDLATYPPSALKRRFGIVREVLWLCANGIDTSPVDPHSLDKVKSMGQQITLPRDYRKSSEVKTVILELAEMIGYRVRSAGYAGKTIILTLKDHNFNCFSRMKSLQEYTDLSEDIYRGAAELLDKHWVPFIPVRMVGVTLANLINDSFLQIDVLGKREKLERLARACDCIRDRYGEKSLKRAASLLEAGVLYS